MRGERYNDYIILKATRLYNKIKDGYTHFDGCYHISPNMEAELVSHFMTEHPEIWKYADEFDTVVGKLSQCVRMVIIK